MIHKNKYDTAKLQEGFHHYTLQYYICLTAFFPG